MGKTSTKKWTEVQDQTIIQEYGKKTAKEIGLAVGIPAYDVSRRAKKLGVWVNTTEPHWSLAEDAFLRENYGSLSASEIGEKINRGYDAVKKRARTLKIAGEAAEKWTDEDIYLLQNNFQNKQYVEIASLLGKSKSSIEHKTSRLGFIKDKKKYTIKAIGPKEIWFNKTNHNFFETPNLLNSFVAGLLSADGNVSDDNKLQIALKSTDKTYLQNVVHLFSEHKLKEYNHTSKLPFNYGLHTSQMSVFRITSKKICTDLWNNFNIGPRKSLTYEPPTKLNLENSLAFIIGYIDGDGSIKFLHHKQKQNGIEYSYPELTLQLLGTKNYLEWVKSIFNNYINLSNNIYQTGNIYRLQFSGKKTIELYKILNAINVPKLARKWTNPQLSEVPGLE